MFPAAFVLKINTRQWRLCLVKQVPGDSSSNWMLFGGHKIKPNDMFQIEFKPTQEMQLINHLVNLAMTERNTKTSYAEICMELITNPPAVSCITTLWSLKGIEMYWGKRIHTPEKLYNNLHHDVCMLSLTPQTSRNTKTHRGAYHPMKTRSKQEEH